MKIKNYLWNGFGFPVMFSELPAIQVRGELVPDIDFNQFAKPLIQIICSKQKFPLSGNQVKFIRNFLGLGLREFAKFMNVTHQSVMRWEKKKKIAARIDVNTEIVMRIKVLKALHSNAQSIEEAVEKVNEGKQLEASAGYKTFKPIHMPDKFIHSAL